MKFDPKLPIRFGSHEKLLGVVVGSGAVALMAMFGLTHPAPHPGSAAVWADSGDETKFPPYSSPAVAPMNMGATTTAQPTDEPTALPTSKAVPAIKAGK